MYSKKFFSRILSFCILIFSISAFAQNRTITGTVTSEEGEPLLGVNIIQKGTSNGVVTDFNGNYEIQLVPENEILVYSFIGFIPQEQEVSNRSVVDVILQTDDESLDEVVVVGYGSQKKSDITGSVSVVESKDLEKAINNTVDQLLQGRASGVVVTSSSGAPGARSTIRIRGNNSISGDNSPLYVIDGIPINGVPDFNPSDVKTIEVLKDASATAIYGSRGANGVILISTKRGKVGKTIIDLNYESTFSNIISDIEVLNGQDYAEYRNESAADLGNTIPFPNPEQYVGKGIDWQNEILRTGHRSNIGLNLSGGKEDIKFFVSGNFLKDNGIIIESDYNRGSIRTNLDIDTFDDKLNFLVGLNATHIQTNQALSATRGFPDQLGPVTNALLAEPLVPNLEFSGLTAEGFQFYNPYLEVTAKDHRTFNTDLFFSNQITWSISDPLALVFNSGINFRQDITEIFYPSSVGQGINSIGTALSNTGRAYDYSASTYLRYDETFDKKHSLNATVGVEYNEFNNYAFNTNVSNFELETLGLDNVGIGTSLNAINSGRSLSVLQSGFIRLNYGFLEKYLLTFTGRADGSSRFAKNEKWGFFPSAAAVWVLSKEKFMNNVDVISDLRIRASYGETGSQSIAPYQSLARYGTIQYPVGNTPSLGYVPNSVENPDLRWETTEQLDIGFELSMFNNRLNLTTAYFNKTTRDLLQSIRIPSQSGFGNALINFGSIANKGVEVELEGRLFTQKKFGWNTNLNFTTYKNEVLELGGAEEIFGPPLGANFAGSGHIYRPGEEYGQFFGLKATGLIQEDDFDAEGNPTFAVRNNDTKLGHWKFEDLNNDGIINLEDRTIIGNPNPDYIFGWNNDLFYKNFSLNLFIQGSIGNDIYNAIGTVLNSGFQDNQSYKNQTVDWYENRYTVDNPTNDIRYPSLNSPSPPAANFMVEDGSYIRLKNISLRYTLDKIPAFDQVQLFLTGTNLITITDYTGYDPEVSSFGANSLAPGVDLGVYPRQSSYTFGVNLKF